MPSARTLQVLASCAALVALAPATRAQSPNSSSAAPSAPASAATPSAYEALRARTNATHVDSPDQVRGLRATLAGHTIEIVGRVAGVMSNRKGSLILLQCADPSGAQQNVTLEIPPVLAANAASMRALRASASVRILALVNAEDKQPMLVPLAATNEAAPTPLFREQEDQQGDMVIMSPVNGALPLPKLRPQAASGGSAGQDAAGTTGSPGTDAAADAFSSLPKVRVPAKRNPGAAFSSGSAMGQQRLPAAPRAYLAPRVPELAPLEPSVQASAQRRAPSRPSSRGGQPSSRSAPAQAPIGGSDPPLFADDERIEAQVPAYETLVRRFNKKLSDAQVEEIARGLLTASYSQNMDPRFLAAIVAVESDFDIYCTSSSGAMGLGQLMPFNMPEVGMQRADAWNPTKNLLATAMLLRGHLNDFKNRPNGTLLAVAAYNAGPNAVKRAGYKVPPGAQVQRYVWKVYYRYKEFAPELFR